MLDYFLWGLAFLVLILGHEYLWPVIYQVRSRRHRCGEPSWQMWHPLAITLIYDQIQAVKKYGLLEKRQAEFLTTGRQTMLKQGLLEFEFITMDPENLKAVFATQFNDFVTGKKSRVLAVAFGWGIFMLDGEPWKHSRSLLRPQFARDQISHLHRVRHHTGKLISLIPEDQFVDMQPLFHQFTMDTATEFLLGVSVNALPSASATIITVDTSMGPITSQDFIESYQELQGHLLTIMITGNLGYFLNRSQIEFHKRRLQLFVESFILHPVPAPSPDTFVLAHALAKSTSNMIEIRDQLVSILLAGRDTTGTTLSFATYFLAQHPDIWHQLRKECLDLQPTTFEEVKRAPLLNAVLNETLRLAPPVPLNMKEAARDTTLPRGGGEDESQPVFVPKGTVVSMSPHATQRDPQYWGEHAEEFRPERWLDGSNNRPRHPWAYIPFSGGPRICLGQQFALAEMATTLCELARTFRTLIPEPSSPSKPPLNMSVTLGCGGGVNVRFIR